MKQLPTTQHEAMEWFASHGAGDGWIDVWKVARSYRDQPHYGAKSKILEKGFIEKSEDRTNYGQYR